MNPALEILQALDRHLRAPGAVRLLGGAALILGYGLRRMTDDADLLLDEAEVDLLIEQCEFGEALAATNAELEPKGLYVTHIWGPEQQILSPDWRAACRRVDVPGLAKLEVSVLGPIDLLLSKLCRADEGDLADIRHLLAVERLAPEAVRRALSTAVVPAEFAAIYPVSCAKVEALLSFGV